MRCTIVRYSSLQCKFPITGSSLCTTTPGGDVPPYGTWVPVPLLLSCGDPSPSPATCPCGSLPPTLLHNSRSSGAHGAPCLRSRATFPRTGERPTYLLERGPRTYWREAHVPTGERPTYLPERAHVPTGERPTYLLERGPRTYWREARVPTGERPAYLLERGPRTYWREARVPTGEKQASNLLFWKGLETRRLYRRLEEDTDNRVCVG